MEIEKIRKLKRASVPKGDRKSRSARDMSIRFGSGRVYSIRVGSDQVIFFKVMKVRAHISMVKMMGKVQLQKADPHQEHVVSSVNEGAKELKKQNKGHMN